MKLGVVRMDGTFSHGVLNLFLFCFVSLGVNTTGATVFFLIIYRIFENKSCF